MKKTTTQIFKAFSLSVALLGSAAVITAISLPDTAYAQNGKGGGNGNGGGKGNGGGNGGGKSEKAGSEKSGGGSGNSQSQKMKVSKEKAAKVKAAEPKKVKAKPKRKDLADELGVSRSELGALNAANASPNALKNASPNSRVGRIAAYRDSVIAGEELQKELVEKQDLLDGMDPPRDMTLIEGDLAIAEADVLAKQQVVDDLEGVADLDLAALEIARGDLAVAVAAETALLDEQAAAVAYGALDAEVADLVQQVEDQPELERSLLEAASNKPVTDDVEAAVKVLLGL